MSGLHGHIFHLYDYDNPHLSFGDIKNIFKLISNGQMTLYEKIDGQNIVFSYDIKNHNTLFARNKGNIVSRGMLLSDVQNKWNHLPAVQKTYVQAYLKLDQTLSKFKNEDLSYIFGNANKIWYSAEIVSILNPNVIHYNINAIILHKSGYVFDKTGNKLNINTDEQFNKLLFLTENANTSVDWHIFGPIIIKNNKLKNIKWHIDSLNEVMMLYNLSDDDPVCRLVSKAFVQNNLSIKNLSENDKIGEIFASLKYKRIKKKELCEILGKEKTVEIYPFIKQEEILKKRFLKPLEWVVHQFAVDLLDGLESNILANSQKEIKRLKKVVYKQIVELEKTNKDKLGPIVTKLGHINKINTTVEGVIFTYKGNTYKLTGLFSPINQLLGMTRY
jgi:hypothetical protein